MCTVPHAHSYRELKSNGKRACVVWATEFASDRHVEWIKRFRCSLTFILDSCGMPFTIHVQAAEIIRHSVETQCQSLVIHRIRYKILPVSSSSLHPQFAVQECGRSDVTWRHEQGVDGVGEPSTLVMAGFRHRFHGFVCLYEIPLPQPIFFPCRYWLKYFLPVLARIYR